MISGPEGKVKGGEKTPSPASAPLVLTYLTACATVCYGLSREGTKRGPGETPRAPCSRLPPERRVEELKKKISAALYRFIRFMVWVFYPRTGVEGLDFLPEEPCLVVGNHAQMHGPIACELYFPGAHSTWCAGEMMHLREVPDYAFHDFWRDKPRSVRWLFRLFSYLIAPISVCVFNNARCVGVYHDMRIMTTFRETIGKLKAGERIVIFPEHDAPGNGLLWEFQDRFVDMARLYYRQTGKALLFVPLYVAPALRTMYLGAPLRYDPSAPADAERERIARGLSRAITGLARALPRHRVVPYRPMPKKQYPYNKIE